MTTEQTLDRLAGATSAAILGVLEMLAGAQSVQPGAIHVLPEGADPLAGVTAPVVAANVGFVDAVEGENVMVLPTAAVRGLAAAMMGMPPEQSDDPLSELELSAAGEAMNQLMSAAAAATGNLLGQEVDIAPPDTRVVATQAELAAVCSVEGAAVSATFSIFDAPCRLVHLVPPAFVLALTRALGGGAQEEGGGGRGGSRDEPLRQAALDVPVRLWAELGRAQMPIARAVSLAQGAVVELDREADAPIELYVDGMRFATGRLVVTDEGELAVSLETVTGHPHPNELHQEAA
jgi:flagellar motor switch protein FliN/FliY